MSLSGAAAEIIANQEPHKGELHSSQFSENKGGWKAVSLLFVCLTLVFQNWDTGHVRTPRCTVATLIMFQTFAICLAIHSNGQHPSNYTPFVQSTTLTGGEHKQQSSCGYFILFQEKLWMSMYNERPSFFQKICTVAWWQKWCRIIIPWTVTVKL